MVKDKKATGTIIDLDAAEGSWFTFFNSRIRDDGEVEYDEPLPGAGRFCLRSMNKFVDDYYSSRKSVSEFVFNKKSRGMERVTYSKEMTTEERKQYQADLWDYVIVGFDGFFDKSGNEITCTKENKLKLAEVPAVDRFIGKCLKTLGENAIKQVETLNENL